jgi:cytochrome c-type biogenesis protein CcmH
VNRRVVRGPAWLVRRLRGALLAVTMAAAAVVVVVHVPAAQAAEAPLLAADPQLEAQVQAIAVELRCLVCQNQTIADSSAPLALDLRKQVREMLQRGQSREQVVAYMTARYGDFVLYRPPVKGSTALLWFGPFVLLLLGVAVLALVLRRRARLAPERFEPDPEELR